jgi:hypothetical protein
MTKRPTSVLLEGVERWPGYPVLGLPELISPNMNAI